MSFYAVYEKYKDFDFDGFFSGVTDQDIENALNSEHPRVESFLALLSGKAESFLEKIAEKAHDKTLRYFGKTIQLYTPLYLSNYCVNQCEYCGFNSTNKVERKKLTLEEVKTEAEFIAATGLKHILILTGDSREMSPVSYINSCVNILKDYFSSISIEIYALEEEEYEELIASGVDGLTIYQETYNEKIYDKVHIEGPKKDYMFRLDAPERAAKNGMRTINIGSLLGLDDWRKDVFFAGLHANYLQKNFSSTEIGVSIPRITPHAGTFKDISPVKDKDMVQIMLALRMFLPRVGITVSTRESSLLRENLIPLGVTKMSAGSTTKVGGHTSKCAPEKEDEQFKIFDQRDVGQVKDALRLKGYQPVLKDWMEING